MAMIYVNGKWVVMIYIDLRLKYQKGTCDNNDDDNNNQRTNGTVNAHLMSGPRISI